MHQVTVLMTLLITAHIGIQLMILSLQVVKSHSFILSSHFQYFFVRMIAHGRLLSRLLGAFRTLDSVPTLRMAFICVNEFWSHLFGLQFSCILLADLVDRLAQHLVRLGRPPNLAWMNTALLLYSPSMLLRVRQPFRVTSTSIAYQQAPLPTRRSCS